MRTAWLADAPPGLMLDEGRGGLCALALLRGDPVLPYTHVSDTFSFFPTALLFRLFGPSTFVLRLVPAFWGTVSIPALWWFMRPLLGAESAILGAGFLAGCRWHIGLSRLALSCVQYPLAMVLAAGLFLRAFDRNRLRDAGTGRFATWRPWAWLGLALGAGFHAYIPGRILPPLFMLVGLSCLALESAERGLRLRGLVLTLLVTAVSATVFGWYLFSRPDLLLWRFGEVAGESPTHDLAGRFADLIRGFGALNWRGDGDLAHTFPAPASSPFLGNLLASLWLPGVPLLFSELATPGRLLLVAWLTAGFAGSVFGGPHTFRMGSLAPLACATAGIAAARWIALVQGRTGGRPGWMLCALPVILLAGTIELAPYASGFPWGHDRDALARSYRIGEGALARRIVEEAARRPIYLGPEFSHAPGTDIERYAAATIFLSARVLHWRTPSSFADLAGDHGGILFPLPGDVQFDLLDECFPHGVLLSPEPPPGVLSVPGAWLVGAAEARGAKLSLARYAEMARVLGKHDEAFARSHFAEAESEIDKAVAGWPGIGGVHTRRGRLFLQIGRVAEAESEARTALALGARGAQAWLLLANTVALQNRPTEAADLFARTIRENPVLEDAWYNRIVTLLQGHQRATALVVLRQACLRFPRSGRLGAMAKDLLR